MTRKPVSMKLYWCVTVDHDEDWFIIARSARKARQIHEDNEGYGRGDADAVLVCTVPLANILEGWPSTEILELCGGKFIKKGQPRVVKFGTKTFAEGSLDYLINIKHDNVFEAKGQGRPNGTPTRLERN